MVQKEDPPNDEQNNNLGFKPRKCPPQNDDLALVKNDLLNMVKNIKFRNTNDNFQDQLRKDI